MVSCIAALALLQLPAVEQPVARPVEPDFTVPIVPAYEQRIAVSPRLDGEIEPEEWDDFATVGDTQTWFQWEPGVLHAAAKLPVGQDLLVSLDLRGDGWLVGSDNLEVRLTWDGSRAKATLRRLDATHPEGPEWSDASDISPCLAFAATGDSAHWTAEMSLHDWGMEQLPVREGAKLAVRFDAGSKNQSDYAPFLPRLVAPVRLAMERVLLAPEGFRFRPEFRGRSVVPGQSLRIRFTFEGSQELRLTRAEMRTEGLGQEEATLQAEPFPGFDRKGRAFVDYPVRVASEATTGYRVARCTLLKEQGDPIVCQASYQIAPLVGFEAVLPKGLVSEQRPIKVRVPVYIRSNVLGRVDGVFDATLPEGWTSDAGLGKRFIIPNSRGSVRKVFDATIPAGARGVFPLRLRAEFDRGKSVEQTVWITVL